MNYYNPYFSYPYMGSIASNSGGLFKSLLGNGINWSSLLSGTQKTLNIVNQTIPLIKQVSPVMKNAKTMFKIMNEFRKEDTPPQNVKSNDLIDNNLIIDETNINLSNNNGPTFFI